MSIKYSWGIALYSYKNKKHYHCPGITFKHFHFLLQPNSNQSRSFWYLGLPLVDVFTDLFYLISPSFWLAFSCLILSFFFRGHFYLIITIGLQHLGAKFTFASRALWKYFSFAAQLLEKSVSIPHHVLGFIWISSAWPASSHFISRPCPSG